MKRNHIEKCDKTLSPDSELLYITILTLYHTIHKHRNMLSYLKLFVISLSYK